MMNFLTKSTENGTDADLVYLDFAKVFNSVPHYRLICILHNYGISGNLLPWFRIFITLKTTSLSKRHLTKLGKCY